MTYLVFTVNGISATDTTSRTGSSIIVAPAGTTLSVGTIASHVTRVTADATDDAGSVVLLLRTVVLAMTDLTTVLASLVLVVSERTVECGEFSELVSLEFVLAFRNRCSLNMLAKPSHRVDIYLQSQ